MLKLALSFLCILAQASPSPLKVGLVLDKGGRDDKSFNSAAYRGATETCRKQGLHVKVMESSEDTALEPNLKTFAQRGYDLIIGIGFIQRFALNRVAKLFPKKHFLLIDAELDLPNVRSVVFKEQEGTFLVGALAGMKSQTQVIGFVGGMKIPMIERFAGGYAAGARQILGPKAVILENYVGTSTDAWRNPTKAKELALSQFRRRADVIFCAAGASCQGVFDAAEEKSLYAIGVDSNQNWVKPGRILTSMIKRVDLAVQRAIESAAQGKFEGGIHRLGLKEEALDFAIDEHNRLLVTPAMQSRADKLRQAVISGEILVPDVSARSQ